MAGQTFVTRRYFCFLPALHSLFNDKTFENYFDEVEEVTKPIPQTGFDRVRALFGYSKHGVESKEQAAITQLTVATLIFGTCIGTMKDSRTAHENFIATNLHEKFLSPYEAKRKMMDHIIVNSFKGGFKFGWKCAVFTFIYTTTVAIISAYRDKEGVLEHSVGGALAGGFVRMYLGYKATLVAAGVGSFLSSIVGVFIVMINKGFNVTLADVRQFQYELKLKREKQVDNFMKSDPRREEQFNSSLLRKKMVQLDSEDNSGYKIDDEDKVFVMINPQANDNDDSKKETRILKENM